LQQVTLSLSILKNRVVRSNFARGQTYPEKGPKGQANILWPASVIWEQISGIWPKEGQPGNPDSDVQLCELYIGNIV